jgi:arylsulfatase A-like enzyme
MQELGFDYVYQTSGRVVALRGVRQAMKDGRTWQTGEDVYGDYLFKNGLLNKFVKENGKVPTTLDGDTAYLDGHFTTVALQQLNSYSGNKPFFMWLNFSTPHGPYDVPKRFHDMFKPEDLPPAIEASTEKFQIPAALKRHKSNLSKAEIASDRAAYSATIAYMDEQIGRVLKFLRNSKFADNTIVVFFSDQGVMAGDHGLQHKSTLFKEILNPALIIYYPKQFKPSRVKTPVELLDLAKTVLDIAGADESILKECPNGNSLLPFLTGKGKFSGNGLAFAEIEGFIAVYDGRYKYFENAELPILFDLENDPDETNNFVASNPKKAFELREQVLSWMKRTGEFKKPARPANDDEED